MPVHNIFSRKKKTLTIPYPEESPDYSRTVANTDLDSALDDWMIKYNVPERYRNFWKTEVVSTLDDNLPHPAETSGEGGVRYLKIHPEWTNPGVIAHEQAHNSYAFLNMVQKVGFSVIYTVVKVTDPLIVYLYSVNPYGKTNNIEGHAEVYRYLGGEMPGILKGFYPKLF